MVEDRKGRTRGRGEKIEPVEGKSGEKE